MRVDTLDHLAIEVQHKPQHAVRRRVLRPKIDGEGAYGCLGHDGLDSMYRRTMLSSAWAVRVLRTNAAGLADLIVIAQNAIHFDEFGSAKGQNNRAAAGSRGLVQGRVRLGSGTDNRLPRERSHELNQDR